jgi:Glycosyl hydrolases family 25
MRADLDFTRAEIVWRVKHGVDPAPRRARRGARRLLARVFGAVPPGPHGFDISSYQPAAPNFRQGGRTFAIFKATEGTGYFDPHFNANRAAAHAQGCAAIGLYHFARPGSHSAAAEAAYFLAHAGAPRPNEFAVLDYEVPPWNQAWIVRFIRLAQAAGWNIAFYTYAGMAAANATDQVRAATPYYYPAGYGSNPPSADRWADIGWTLWQHTDGAGASADGPWDCSVADPNLLAQLAHAVGPPPPAPQEDDDDMPALAIGTINPGEVASIAVPPPHAGGAGWGAVWFSLAVDFNPQVVRIAYGNPDAWQHIEDGVVVPVGRRAGWQLDPGAEVVSVIHHGSADGDAGKNLPISYLVEAMKGP